MNKADFVIVGSSGGGGTIGWLLAKAGFSVVMLELGSEFGKPLEEPASAPLGPDGKVDPEFNPYPHDEYRFRLERPDPKRRPRGDYNTLRKPTDPAAAPFNAGWTASILGGGSVLWGTWAYRALPIDFRLNTHFAATGQLDTLNQWGYSIPDWPVSYSEMDPFYNVAETLLAVSGDRRAVNNAIASSGWYQELSQYPHFQQAGNWTTQFPYPCPPYARTPVGEFVFAGAQQAGFNPVPLPTAIVAPGTAPYQTRLKLQEAVAAANLQDSFWQQSAAELWSERVRHACNLCGFCGEYICWGKSGPKSGTHATMLREMRDLPNAEVRTDARAYEVVYDPRTRRASGVRYLDVSDPDHPKPRVQNARFVIVSCGAVQTARLLLMSGPPAGLGNGNGLVGRHAMFHLFGLGISLTLPKQFNGKALQGLLHGEYGHTGNTTTFEPYFMKDERPGSPTGGLWWKGGTMTSTAKKNPLENADGKLRGNPPMIGQALLTQLENYNRSLEVRFTGDDLPMARNRVDLDPSYVDEYGFPVARITRDYGPAETLMFQLGEQKLRACVDDYVKRGVIRQSDVGFSPSRLFIIGDHQMGTCRMGDDPSASVVDRNCRLHEVPNVFVVDTSFFPTGFGLNPMVTTMANALRVGTWIVDQAARGSELG